MKTDYFENPSIIRTRFTIYLLLATMFAFFGCEKELVRPEQLPDAKQMAPISPDLERKDVKGRYIVLMEETFGQESEALNASFTRKALLHQYEQAQQSTRAQLQAHFRRYDIDWRKIDVVLTAKPFGFAGEIPQELAESLKKAPQVASVSQDFEFRLPDSKVATPPVGRAAQTVDWGVDYVGSGDASQLSRKCFIIDTGVDMGHPDLNIDVTLSRNMYSLSSPPQDYNGHGTHVAGIVGAKNNQLGTKGVAHGASIVALKAANRYGWVSWSRVLHAYNYIYYVGQPGDVVNCSFGIPRIFWNYSRHRRRIRRITGRGMYVVAASGNFGLNANTFVPAAVNGTGMYTVSAMRQNGSFWWWSHYGSSVDYAAPGVAVTSLWLNGQIRTLTGTSMAAPHVAGILLYNNGVINSRGVVTGDRDNTPDPIAVL